MLDAFKKMRFECKFVFLTIKDAIETIRNGSLYYRVTDQENKFIYSIISQENLKFRRTPDKFDQKSSENPPESVKN